MQMFLTPEENIIEQLRTENAALKEQITNTKYNYLGAMADCKRYEETIEQQAEAIRLKDAALEHVVGMHLSMVTSKLCRAALAIQHSPEILQARNERVAEACAKLTAYLPVGCGLEGRTIAEAIRAGEWRKYL